MDFLDEEEWLQAFVDLPHQIYDGDPLWAPTSRRGEMERLRSDHAFFAEGRERHFLALRDGQAVARCASIVNPRLVAGSPPIGMIGFFEARDDVEAVRAMFERACAWLRDEKAELVRGPIDRDTWHRYRVMVSGFEEEPIMMEPYNKTYYARLFEDCGWKVCAEYISSINEDLAAIHALHSKFVRFTERRGWSYRSIDMKRFDEELELLYRISVEAFSGNYMFASLTLDEFLDHYRGVRHLVDPDLIIFGHDPQGEPAGFVFGLPERSREIIAMGEDRGLLRKAAFWWKTRKPTRTMNAKTICVLPDARGKGLAPALSAKIYESALAKGYEVSRHVLIKKDEIPRFDKGVGRIFKEYVLFERGLSA